jgi:phosphatidylethanolamine-binding protein (PEBP) family uncharacterized protein
MKMTVYQVEKVGITSCMIKQPAVTALEMIVFHHAVSDKSRPMLMQNEEIPSTQKRNQGPNYSPDFAWRVTKE